MLSPIIIMCQCMGEMSCDRVEPRKYTQCNIRIAIYEQMRIIIQYNTKTYLPACINVDCLEVSLLADVIRLNRISPLDQLARKYLPNIE